MAKELKFTHPAKARALIAYIKSDGVLEAHKITNSYLHKVNNLLYVVLTSMSTVKAVYRKNNDNSLRRLTRYPKKIDDMVPKRKVLTAEVIGNRQMYVLGATAMGQDDLTGLANEWFSHIDGLRYGYEYVNELVGMTLDQIKDGQKAGFITSPPNIDSIREYRARLSVKDEDKSAMDKTISDSMEALKKKGKLP